MHLVSIYPSVHLPIHLSINLSIDLSLLYLFPNYLTILLFVYLSIYPSIWYVSNLIHSLILSYHNLSSHPTLRIILFHLSRSLHLYLLPEAGRILTDWRAAPNMDMITIWLIGQGLRRFYPWILSKKNVGVVGSLQYWHGRQKQNQNLPWELQYLGGFKFSSASFYCL